MLDRGDNETPRGEMCGEEGRLHAVAREAMAEEHQRVGPTVGIGRREVGVRGHRERRKSSDLGRFGGR